MAIFVTYDTSERVYTVRVGEGPVARTIEVDDVHIVDVDDQGRPLNIEVLDPSAADLPRVAGEFGLDDKLAEILAAVGTQVPTVVASTTANLVWLAMSAPPGQISVAPATSAGEHRPAPREIELIGNG